MVAKSRGRDDNAKGRGARRRPSLDTPEKHLPGEDDLGARGGVLAAGEVKALLHASKTVDVFRRLGDGVLSPPRTPDGENGEKALLTDAETRTLEQIAGQKEEARRRHTLLKDRMKFVTMVKQAAGRVTAEKELKPKEYCGYDSRIEWTEQRFQAWRNSQAGQQAFEVGTSAHENGDKGDGAMDEDLEICDRKKCARHFEWAKLAVDDLRFEMSDNSDRMRALDQKEKRIRETAFFRSRSSLSKEGTVEIHAPLGGSEAEAGSRMDVDVPAAAHDVVATVEDGSEAVAT
jgi:COMPASS component SPP1